jgi:biotin operon repressor
MILAALRYGRHNARTTRDLCDALGVSSRELQLAVEALRQEGSAAICSGSDGYWLPESPVEMAANSDRRHRRSLSQLVTVRGERRYLRRWQSQGQRTLWEAA